MNQHNDLRPPGLHVCKQQTAELHLHYSSYGLRFRQADFRLTKFSIFWGCFFLSISMTFGQRVDIPFDRNTHILRLSESPGIQGIAEHFYNEYTVKISKDVDINDKTILGMLNIDDRISFKQARETKSRFGSDAIFRKYQQYYKGVMVHSGGYTIKMENTGGQRSPRVDLFTPNIYFNIDIDVIPTINKQAVSDILANDEVVKLELFISDRFEKVYNLYWLAYIRSHESEQFVINAHSGEVVHSVKAALNLTADTWTYDNQNLNDFTQGNTTFLRTPDDRLRIFEGLIPADPLVVGQWQNNLTPTTNNMNDWGDTDATVASRQSFYTANLVIPEFLNMGVEFGDVHVATGGEGGQAIQGSTVGEAYVRLGVRQGGIPVSVFDIMAHELAHCFLFEFLHAPLFVNTNLSLHEGIADLVGSYIENFIIPGGTDWVTGGDEPVLAQLYDRDQTIQVCETNLQNAGQHQRGRVISHWYFAISTGIPQDNIPAIGMQTAMNILVEALNNLNDPDAGFPEMREQTMLVAEINFGVCSPEYRAVSNAWDRVCVTGDIEVCPCDSYPAPPMSSLSFITTCPVSAHLNTLHTGTIPNGATLVWSTDGDPSNGVSPHLNSPVTHTGTYYAYYYNAGFNCYSPASDPVVVDGAQTQDIHIMTNTTYSTDMEYFRNIYVQKGATLTVTSTLTMNTNVGIFVEDDSRLILDGGKLTACGQKWEGVKVAGQFDGFAPAGASNLQRGYVTLKNNAILEKAVIGVDGKDVYVSDYVSAPQHYHGGGLISITNSTVQDCGIGVRLHRYGWGAVIGAGPSGPGYPIGYVDEESAFTNSRFKNCNVAVFSENNIGLEISDCIFEGNDTDYEGYQSAITANRNEFLGPLSVLASAYPVIPGSSITNNLFSNSGLAIDGQGNITRHNFNDNSASSTFLSLTGELWYRLNNNAFTNSVFGCFIESTGENLENRVLNSSFDDHPWAISVFGDNDTEFLANCFSGSTQADIAINGGASIHMRQGTQQASAGNCFSGKRIKTGTAIAPFTYWTKDGYHPSCQPLQHCKFPGACNGFEIMLAQNEVQIDCVTDIVDDPPSEFNCACGSGTNGCTNAIASIRTAIAGLGDGSQNDLLKAQYRRCIDRLIRTYVDTTLALGQTETCIAFLAAQPEFRYRIMAYGIMAHNMQYNRAGNYLDTLATSKAEEQDFVDAQKIWLDYITDINSFKLLPADSITLRTAGEAYNTFAGYARTIFYMLTGERITRSFTHLDSTVTQRNYSDSVPEDPLLSSPSIQIYPNPVDQDFVEVAIPDYSTANAYNVLVFDLYGRLLTSSSVTSDLQSVSIGAIPGIYFVLVRVNGYIAERKSIIRL